MVGKLGLIGVKLSEGLNFSAAFRSEAEEKFKVNLKSVHQVNKVSNQDAESEGNFYPSKPKAHQNKEAGGSPL